MFRTRVGYAGGTKDSPAYHDLGDHTETIQIDYDPTVVSYRELLDIFWSSHSPVMPSLSRQYMSIVFYHNEEQRKLAMETKRLKESSSGGKVYTQIVPYSAFHLAEAYHQKHQLQRVPELMREFRAIYPDTDDFINSTAVARVNGYLGGYGTLEELRDDLPGFGLSPEASDKLLDIVRAVNR